MLDGDISEIPSETIRTLHEIVEHELKSKNYRIIVNLVSKAGTSNFTGTIYRASFSSQDESDSEKGRKQKLIIEVASQQAEWREHFSTRSTFLQEKYMYDTVSRS